MAIIRLTEPNVRTQLSKQLSNCFSWLFCNNSKLSEEEKLSPFERPDLIQENDLIEDNLNSFLTSSLNVELVYTILKGISHFVSIPQLETWINGDIPQSRFNDYSIKIAKLADVKIYNYKIWENAHQ